MKAELMDPRGYAGAEKNRRLEPQEVIEAREAYFQRRTTTRHLAAQLGISVESVRKMLRGDTYGNVGQALPLATAVRAVYERAEPSEELVKELLERQAAADAKPAPEEVRAHKFDPLEIMERFSPTQSRPAEGVQASQAAEAGEPPDADPFGPE